MNWTDLLQVPGRKGQGSLMGSGGIRSLSFQSWVKGWGVRRYCRWKRWRVGRAGREEGIWILGLQRGWAEHIFIPSLLLFARGSVLNGRERRAVPFLRGHLHFLYLLMVKTRAINSSASRIPAKKAMTKGSSLMLRQRKGADDLPCCSKAFPNDPNATIPPAGEPLKQLSSWFSTFILTHWFSAFCIRVPDPFETSAKAVGSLPPLRNLHSPQTIQKKSERREGSQTHFTRSPNTKTRQRQDKKIKFRPMSLMSIDVTILNKVLANKID